ncbi:MAG: ribulokinase [Acidobacteria bacterium]|nr:ribulokinase [Acidobacteriota bacterium]MBS1864495.1 ribulokinase [Acidobacteriota bacterium]
MSIVAGIDFGTLSVRASIFDSTRGMLGSGCAEYPLHRKRDDPDYATQSHLDHMNGLVGAVQMAIASAGIEGTAISAIAVDTTGSSVVPVGSRLQPLDDYYLWCDHRAWREAQLITKTARELGIEAIRWCGGTYSSEWGFSKVLHWLRNHPEKRESFATALEHCDMAAATLCGITQPEEIPRSICAMGHKWMWNESLGGLPPEDFLVQVDPLLAGLRAKMSLGRYAASDSAAGQLSKTWADKMGLRKGIPVPVGALDAHWDAVGAGVRLGDVVNVVGTSTCMIAISKTPTLVPGVCGVVPGSVHPSYTGIEAGLSATGDIFSAIAQRAGTTVGELSHGLESYKPGQTGLMRLTWDNGDRTVLVNPELGGVTFGWNLTHSAQDELFAAIEGTAFHTRIILDRLEEYGTDVSRVINAGGIPRKSPILNQIYADMLNKPILVPKSDSTGLGAAIFAFRAVGAFLSIEAAQEALCPKYEIYEPNPQNHEVYDQLFEYYRLLYFALGDQDSEPVKLGKVLPALRRIAAASRR